jgi:hypothetical protein
VAKAGARLTFAVPTARQVSMSLTNKTILFFAAPWYEDLELWYPKIRLEEEGASTVVAGLGEGLSEIWQEST